MRVDGRYAGRVHVAATMTNGAPKLRLTGIPASHPALAAQLMLDYKGLRYVRRDLPNQLQKLVLPLVGYEGRTVPALRIDGRRVQGTMAIARALEQLAPEPALFPADARDRGRVEVLEAWADSDLQDIVRTLGMWAAKCDPAALAPIAAASAVPIPAPLLRACMPLLGPAVLASVRLHRERAQAAWDALPAALDRVDAAIADGVIGGSAPNAADFQVATCVRLATLIDAVGPQLHGRPATALAHRLVPDYPGRFTAPLDLG